MPDVVTHTCPKNGKITAPCCGKTLFELPRTDKMTLHPERVTCKGGGKNVVGKSKKYGALDQR